MNAIDRPGTFRGKEREAARAIDDAAAGLAKLFEKETPAWNSIHTVYTQIAANAAQGLVDKGVVDETPLLKTALDPFGLALSEQARTLNKDLAPAASRQIAQRRSQAGRLCFRERIRAQIVQAGGKQQDERNGDRLEIKKFKNTQQENKNRQQAHPKPGGKHSFLNSVKEPEAEKPERQPAKREIGEHKSQSRRYI